MNYIDTDRVINLKRHLYRFASNTFKYLNLSMYLNRTVLFRAGFRKHWFYVIFNVYLKLW